MATEVDRPSGGRIVTFNRAGYVVSDDRLRRGSAEAGTAYDRSPTSNAVQRMTVWCGAGNRRVRVEAALQPDTLQSAIAQQLRDTCAAAKR